MHGAGHGAGVAAMVPAPRAAHGEVGAGTGVPNHGNHGWRGTYLDGAGDRQGGERELVKQTINLAGYL